MWRQDIELIQGSVEEATCDTLRQGIQCLLQSRPLNQLQEEWETSSGKKMREGNGHLLF